MWFVQKILRWERSVDIYYKRQQKNRKPCYCWLFRNYSVDDVTNLWSATKAITRVLQHSCLRLKKRMTVVEKELKKRNHLYILQKKWTIIRLFKFPGIRRDNMFVDWSSTRLQHLSYAITCRFGKDFFRTECPRFDQRQWQGIHIRQRRCSTYHPI